MSKNYLVMGKKGVLVGDPWRASGFIGQKPIKRKEGAPMPKRMADRFEPCLAVIPHHPEVVKPLRRGQLEIIKTFEADSYAEACRVRDAYRAAPVRNGDDQ